jgi:RNA polymerase sigma factor (sigma-70 family)
VHVPRDLQDRVLALDGAARELEALLGHQPTVASWRTPRPGGQHVLDTLHAAHARRADSLDVPYANDDAATLGDTIASHDDGFHRAEQREALARLTAMLPPRDRRILGLRFQHDLTQQEIGELVGLSQMQISRILRQAIAKLRDHAAAEHSRGQAAQVSFPSRLFGRVRARVSDRRAAVLPSGRRRTPRQDSRREVTTTIWRRRSGPALPR